MSRPNSAREALIAEALGDVAKLLDRVEGLMPALDESRRAVAEAGMSLTAQLSELEAQIKAITQIARTQVVEHVVQRTEEAARRAQEMQTRAMAEAARGLFKTEVDRTLQRLVDSLNRLSARMDRPWEYWLTHAATAVVASTATWISVTWLVAR